MTPTHPLEAMRSTPADLLTIVMQCGSELTVVGANNPQHVSTIEECQRVFAIGEAFRYALDKWIALASQDWATEQSTMPLPSPKTEAFGPFALWAVVSATLGTMQHLNNGKPPESADDYLRLFETARRASAEAARWLELVTERLEVFGVEVPEPGQVLERGLRVVEVLSILRSAVGTLEGFLRSPATPGKLDAIARIVADSARRDLETWTAQQEANEAGPKH